MLILLDMDGVLADFVGGACKAHNKAWPYNDAAHLGEFFIEKFWGQTPQEFWKPLYGESFWEGLSPTAECYDILEMLEHAFGLENICLLSSPNSDPECPAGKLKWINKHIPQYSRQYLFGPAKKFCAAPDHLLIDDHDANVDKFRAANGLAFLLPRPWNRSYDKNTMQALRRQIDFLT